MKEETCVELLKIALELTKNVVDKSAMDGSTSPKESEVIAIFKGCATSVSDQYEQLLKDFG